MARVRKEMRTRTDGTTFARWRAIWKGASGKPQSKSFNKRSDAQAWLTSIASGAATGSTTLTVQSLAEEHIRWFDARVRGGVREAVTRDGYQAVLDIHIKGQPAFARTRLCDLSTPKIQLFLDELFNQTGKTGPAKRARKSLVTWCRFGQMRGWLSGNPAQPCIVEATTRPQEGEERLKVPPKDRLAAVLVAAAEGENGVRDYAVFCMLIFGGFRISELLGLSDEALVDTTARIRERLERRYRVLGPVKSASGRRDVPLGPEVMRAIRAWRRLRGPVRAFTHTNGRGEKQRTAGRLFPGDGSDLWNYDDFISQCWKPVMRRAGLVEKVPDSNGKMRSVAAFSPHTLRHVATSLWIEQKLQPKKVQTLLGHSTISLTMDRYGHLWRDEALDDALAEASENLILKKPK